jgi:tRNA-dihydrouridine synthase B
MDHADEPEPVSVQIVGHAPGQLAEAARRHVGFGAQIIDINMGCPAKKVCNVAAGSALLRDGGLVGRILEAVVAAVPVPVTLKIRTGFSRATRNAVAVARIAESAGIAALAVHGRTREDHFAGAAEHETAAAVKAAVRIPVIVNGDIRTPAEARAVLAQTDCDAVMIGRAAHGRPWVFREMAGFLASGILPDPPSPLESCDIVIGHLAALHDFYGEDAGVRIARKHLGWYAHGYFGGALFRAEVCRVTSAAEQLRLTRAFFRRLAEDGERRAA